MFLIPGNYQNLDLNNIFWRDFPKIILNLSPSQMSLQSELSFTAYINIYVCIYIYNIDIPVWSLLWHAITPVLLLWCQLARQFEKDGCCTAWQLTLPSVSQHSRHSHHDTSCVALGELYDLRAELAGNWAKNAKKWIVADMHHNHDRI